jgi:protein-L-isoaspartate(D-aspartate) O-methyltransferase
MEAKRHLLGELGRFVRDRRVLEALGRVPRERFVPPDLAHLAYADMALPIPEGQTISQPLIVAMMTEALALGGGERVLEIGTGSGYQTAVLAELAAEVITLERHEALAEPARRLLAGLGYANVRVVCGDGSLGWPEGAPYGGILVTAAAPRVPPSLLEQLVEGRSLVIPVGDPHEQDLLRVEKTAAGAVSHNLGPCKFVPLIGAEAWSPAEVEAAGFV